MKISELIMDLQQQLAKNGDMEVVSGVKRSGYAEPVIGMETQTVKLINPATSEFDGETEVVLDLSLDDSSYGSI